MIRQFVPQEVCLHCQGCCRFKEQDSVWRPCLLEEEMQELLDKNIAGGACVSLDKKILPVPAPQGERFICPFLEITQNRCNIYSLRPFECQLYPFLINLRGKKILLTVDLNCPYLPQKINTPEFQEYCAYLTAFLNSAKQLRLLKDNPQLLQAYEDVREIIELGPFNETP